MKQSNLVSIVILCFRNFDGIEETIEKIAEQTYKRIELIISDDCSDNFHVEEIQKITEQYAERFENIVVNKNPQNMGTVKHINSLFEKLHGDIILYQGCDDVLYDDQVIADVVDYFAKTDADIVTTQRVVESAKSEIILPQEEDARAIQSGTKNLLSYICKKGNVVSGCGTFYHKKVFEKYGRFDERCRLVEDYAYYMMFLHKGGTIHFMPRKTLKYAWGGVSTSRNPMVEADKKTVFHEMIYPNRVSYGFWDKRILEFRYDRETKHEGALSIGLMIKYPDVVVRQGMQELKGRKAQKELLSKMGG